MTGRLVVVALALLAIICARAAAAAPAVLVSVKPLHSLVAAVMAGAGEPGLIVKGSGSPHTYALRPSDAERLAAARLVVWAGPALESFLAKPLAALAGKAEIIELDRTPGIKVLPARVGGLWEEDRDDPLRKEMPGDRDGHLWLDPENAEAIAHVVAARLAALDPGNAARYRANEAALVDRLGAIDAMLARRLAPLRNLPFVVFHDGYQYLERRYHLDAIGSITVDPEHPPGARRIAEIRAKIMAVKARCVFAEPEFTPTLVGTVVAGTGARTGVLDGLGAALPEGPELYPQMMDGLAQALEDCLAPR
jgi:zinc transport system substrate-binding protein